MSLLAEKTISFSLSLTFTAQKGLGMGLALQCYDWCARLDVCLDMKVAVFPARSGKKTTAGDQGN